MKRWFPLFIFTFVSLSALFAQDSAVVGAFQRNFAKGSLSTKIKVLQDAANTQNPQMGVLYLQAVEFVYDNFEAFQNDPLAEELAVLAVRMIGKIGYQQGADALWKLFARDKTTSIRIEIANALAVVGKGNPAIVNNLNLWLSAQNNVFRSGSGVDLQVVKEVIVTMGKIGDPSSFPALLGSTVLGYAADITTAAQTALYAIKGDFGAMVTEVISKGLASERLAALRLMYASETLSTEQKGEIAVVALDGALGPSAVDPAEKDTIRQLRYESIRAIAALKWAKATPLVIQHFNRTIEEWDKGLGSKSYVLEAISCLGAMGTHEAAVRLTMYLELINSYVDNGQNYDEQVVLAVIKNLEILGDGVAFDYLLYTGYLNYSEKVKQAAREALKNL
jgi:HEAT repeat protein